MSSPAISSNVVSGDPNQGSLLEEDHLDSIAERWAVKYTTLLQKKCKLTYSGNILLHADRRRLVLLDADGITVDAKIMASNDRISLGLSMEFPCHLVEVVDQISCDLSTEALRSDQPNPHDGRSGNNDLTWKISYSTRRDLDRGRMKSYDGTLKFWSSNGWLVLINAKDEPIAVQVIRSEPLYKSGSKVSFQYHVVRVHSEILSTVRKYHMDYQKVVVEPGRKASPPVDVLDDVTVTPRSTASESHKSSPSFAMHTAISLGFDFKAGENFAKEVLRRFSSTVHPLNGKNYFSLVVSFGRATFRMAEETVALALEAALGGFCGSLFVTQLRDRVFSFRVASKEVGFYIIQKRIFVSEKFKCYFHLWSDGGPNWMREFANWQQEIKQQWTLVSPSKRRVKMGMTALNLPAPKPALKHTAPVNKKLVFAEKIHYEAKKGYAAESSGKDSLYLYETKSNPVISFGTTMSIHQEEIGEVAFSPTVAEANKEIDSAIPIEGEDQIEEDKDPICQIVDDATRVWHKSNFLINEEIQSDSTAREEDSFSAMIDDMVYKVWTCGRCLSMGHPTKNCTNDIRCRSCFSYGHIKKQCLADKLRGKVWKPKASQLDTATRVPIDKDKATPEVAGSASIPFNTSRDSLQQPFEQINSIPPPVSNSSPSSPAMAVFELDPTPWLPWGHELIDGGPTRLPRTYYFASQDPPPRHLDHCIALVDPPPPPAALALWRHQVRDFLVGPLQRNVVRSQPSIFGIGLYQMSSPNSVNALVQHGQYQIQNRLLRFVHVGQAPQNHRAAIGFRRGWLMFLGVHPDYRNDFDIAQAVATFGQYHTWNSNDPVTDRVLVCASFPSPQLVPRDVVFGRFATVGGARESWTTPVYILTADFADAMPADEDQMPPDGNPHPFPGELQPNNNLWVNPQYPEIGWDAVQDLGQEQQGGHGGIFGQQDGWGQMGHGQQGGWGQDDMEQGLEQGVLQEMQESMVINLSDSSSSSVNMMEVQQQHQQDGVQLLHNVLNIGMACTIIGPALPPEMMCAKALDMALPSLLIRLVPKPWFKTSFMFLKELSGVRLSVVNGLRGDKQWRNLDEEASSQVMISIEGTQRGSADVQPRTGASKSKTKRKKSVLSIVQPTERRFTRSCLKTDGYRPAPILAVQPKIKKKVRAKNLLLEMEQEATQQKKEEAHGQKEQQSVPAPPIPLIVMQRVGQSLGIAAEKLSKEQLEAVPEDKKEAKPNDD
ncbi:hypothetical protein QYE76_024078 [Lolium multiflorum]|uniref:CCHC-type domain-containing protein n=1 Tax=Lolium multiflorum TaxID=4521 RepID=A0AAD8VUR5_LOLMU|nr:hypothetical protein QYE76_024078 [Lolium multiflorum]